MQGVEAGFETRHVVITQAKCRSVNHANSNNNNSEGRPDMVNTGWTSPVGVVVKGKKGKD